ncbi:MAG TPA: methyl-accepting chemotaxis protein [Patescibacteria group bacterium]|nr:methyl-accepting chemotaxis protein [Patescibacteria group bacterium]
MNFSSLSKKMSLCFSLFIALAIAAVTIPSLYFFSASLETAYEKQSTLGQEGLMQLLENYKTSAATQAVMFAGYPGVSKAVAEKDTATLLRLLAPLAQEAKIDSVTISDEKGVVIARTHENRIGDSVTNQANVRSALQGKVQPTVESGTVVRLSVRAGAPVRNESGQIVGVITPGYTVSKDDIVDQAKRMFGVEASLFLGDERVSTTLTQDGKRLVGTKLDPVIADKVLKQGQKYLGRADFAGKNFITVYAPLLGPNNQPLGVVFAGLDTTELVAQEKQLISIIAVISLGILVIGVFWILWFARGLTSPIQQMLDIVAQVTAGNLTAKLSVRSRDELGLLASHFNQMVEQLRALVTKVNSQAENLSAASEELTASAEQSAQASTQIAAAITGVAAGAEQQLKAVDSTTVVVEQIATDIRQIATKASLVTTTSAKSAGAAQTGSIALEKSITQMNHIEETVIRSSQVVTKLGDRSNEIGTIVDTIAGIASQTNLLALNAAIEAARAGEQGRGFAVVAEEVRKLAEQSQNAAQEIAKLITEIRLDTANAVTAMSEGTEEVHQGTLVVSDAGRAFREIAVSIDEVTAQITEIMQAINHIVDGSQQIADSMRSVDHISQNACRQSQSVSAATEEQSATMEEIAASSHTLAKMAEELSAAVSQFKI